MTDATSLTDRARAVLHEWVQSPSLRRHCEAVAACMGYMARAQNADADLWTAVGLLHDMDFEQYPTLSNDEATSHPYVGVRWLREHGWSDEVTRAILSHASYTGVEPQSAMERTLRAVDELSGFVTAVAFVRPDKSVHSVEVSSVKKKLKDKAFAAAVSREDITHGAELVGVPLEDLIAQVIAALRAEADRLGIAGAPQA